MSIDYDQLRKLLDEATPGPWRVETEVCECCTYVAAPAAAVCTPDMEDAPLIALAPDMAAELLRLRDGVEVIRDELNYLAALLGRDTYYSQSRYVRDQANALTGLLNGDTE